MTTTESDDFEARVRAEVERVLAERDRGRRWLSPAQVAERLNVAVGTLANWRVAGIGPASVKMGRLVRYDEARLTEWENAQHGA